MKDRELIKMCEWGEYEITVALGSESGQVSKRTGWKFGYLAVCKEGSIWRMTHLPSGFNFDPIFKFRSRAKAIAAMIEVAALKNSWSVLEHDELRPIAGKLRAIAAKHGAISPMAKSNPTMVEIGRKVYGTNLNKGAVQ